MSPLVDVAVEVDVDVAALGPRGERVLCAPLLDVVADEGVHGHVEKPGLLKLVNERIMSQIRIMNHFMDIFENESIDQETFLQRFSQSHK